MGLDIYGWVETWNADRQEIWQAVVNVYPLLARENEVFVYVFGITPAGNRVDSELAPLAAARGIPPDASPEAREWDPVEEPHSGYKGHTWTLWSELEPTPWGHGTFPSGEPLPSNWRTLFDVMARLAQEYGTEHVRLIVWFA